MSEQWSDPEEVSAELEMQKQKLAQFESMLDETLVCQRCGATLHFGDGWVRDPHPDQYSEEEPPFVEMCETCITNDERKEIAESHRRFAREAFKIAAESDAPNLLDSTRASLRRLEMHGERSLDSAEDVERG